MILSQYYSATLVKVNSRFRGIPLSFYNQKLRPKLKALDSCNATRVQNGTDATRITFALVSESIAGFPYRETTIGGRAVSSIGSLRGFLLPSLGAQPVSYIDKFIKIFSINSKIMKK